MGRCGSPSSTNVRFTDAAMSHLDSMSVPSRSKINNSTEVFPIIAWPFAIHPVTPRDDLALPDRFLLTGLRARNSPSASVPHGEEASARLSPLDSCRPFNQNDTLP